MTSDSDLILEGQPQSGGEPVFDAPWQARAFAMAVQLHQGGVFQWSEWADRLSQNIKSLEVEGEVVSSDDYYGVWLQTLEEIVSEKN